MRKIILTVLLAIVVIALAAWSVMPFYLREALIYQHPRIDNYSIFHNRTVATGTAVPWAKSKQYNSGKIADSSMNWFRTYGTVAFLVVKNDSLLHEEYWDGYSDTSHSNSFSMAKSIVPLLVGCLVDEGKIRSLDQPVTDFIPEFKGADFQKITIKDALTMSSGLNWDESYSDAFSITTKAYYGNDLPPLIYSLKPIEEPGKIHRYKSGDTQLLSMIVEKASGMHLADYASGKLWKPLGAEHEAFWSMDKPDGNEKAYCCFNSNVRDFARIGQLVLDSGQCCGRQLVSKDYIRQATTADTWLKDEKGRSCTWYGYQFWILNYKGMKISYCRGILGQYIFIIPDKKAVVVRLGSKRSDKYRENSPKDVYLYLDTALSLLD